MILPTHPEGEIRTYRDALDREQVSVDGPKGHVLITREKPWSPFEVWHSDQLSTLTRTDRLNVAIRSACRAVGLPVDGLVWPEKTSSQTP